MELDRMISELREILTREDLISSENPLRNDENLFERGVWDSLSILKVVNILEKNYNIKIGIAEMEEERFESIASLSSFVLKMKKESN